jgi:epoxyqueuosine reductase QueG
LAGGALGDHAGHELRARRAIPLATLADRQAATISVYARNRDYHDLIKGALKRIAGTSRPAPGRT